MFELLIVKYFWQVPAIKLIILGFKNLGKSLDMLIFFTCVT